MIAATIALALTCLSSAAQWAVPAGVSAPQPLPSSPQLPATPLKVIATIPTYAELAKIIGGDHVEVVLLTRPAQDVHSVSATPSLMAKIIGADLCLHTGLDAELWLESLLQGSGNQHLLPGNPKSIDLSVGIPLKDVPAVVDRSRGDVHAYGNTHIWSDPYAVRSMAVQVRDALSAQLPDAQDDISARHAAFHTELTQSLVKWLTKYRSLQGQKVVVYHQSWVYFLERFGLEQVGTLEPKPRVAPTASHLAKLEGLMQQDEVHVILREPYQHPEAADHVARATGAQVLELSTHPGFPAGVDGLLEHFEHNLEALAEALKPRDA